MTYEGHIANSINEKYRMDALRVFISGLKKPLCDILFSTRPDDLPSALALAQEVEANHERYIFATNFSQRFDENSKSQTMEKVVAETSNNQLANSGGQKNPHFQNNNNRQQKRSFIYNGRQEKPEPMDIDPSISRLRRSTNYESQNPPNDFLRQNKNNNFQSSRQRPLHLNSAYHGQQFKRRPESDRITGPKVQRINHLSQDKADENSYDNIVENEVEDIEEEINFLGKAPYSLGLEDQ